MKKLIAVLFTAFIVFGIGFAQELTVSGEVKTGFYWESKQIGDGEAEEDGRVYNNDDAGSDRGRFRLNLQLEKGIIGMKVRFEQTVWNNSTAPTWPYAFAYGNFFEDQLKISAGKMGDSPWAAGGPERWDELDTRVGIRAEIKPNFVPGLNVGFVLNEWDEGLNIANRKRTIVELLKETVLGVSYVHEYFGFRFAYRLDSELDSNADRLNEGSKMLYRVEERILQKYLEGMQIWANGYYDGISSEKGLVYYNWIYFQYAPDAFTAQIRLGLDASSGDRKVLHIRPSFYYHFFNKFLTAGLAFYYCQDFGSKISEASPYQYWSIEPQVKVNFGDAYAALVYNYRNEYSSQDVVTQTHWINLRFVYIF